MRAAVGALLLAAGLALADAVPPVAPLVRACVLSALLALLALQLRVGRRRRACGTPSCGRRRH